MPDTEQLVYTAEEFAKLLRMSRNSFYRMVKQGYLPLPMAGIHKMLWSRTTIDKFLRESGFR